MADSQLRDAERRWRESGTVADEAELLRFQLRVGTRVHDRLALAAYCGYEAAARALDYQHYYVTCNWARTAFVKEGSFFEAQGGLTQDWGKHWQRVWAAPDDLEGARAQAALNLWLGRLQAWGFYDALLRANIVSARLVYELDGSCLCVAGCRRCEAAVLIIQEADAWLRGPSDRNLARLVRVSTLRERGAPGWAPSLPCGAEESIFSAAAVAGAGVVWQAIRQGLIDWALA